MLINLMLMSVGWFKAAKCVTLTPQIHQNYHKILYRAIIQTGLQHKEYIYRDDNVINAIKLFIHPPGIPFLISAE